MAATPTNVVADGKVVSIHYTLTDDTGSVLDSSSGREPLDYLHGSGNIVPGLEEKLSGRKSGEKLKVSVEPEMGYGAHDPRGIQRVPRSEFPDDVKIEAGMQFSAENQEGEVAVVWVVSADAQHVTIDMNHPLAGKTLHFDVSIEGIRDATREEVAHGHPHGPNGHHH